MLGSMSPTGSLPTLWFYAASGSVPITSTHAVLCSIESFNCFSAGVLFLVSTWSVHDMAQISSVSEILPTTTTTTTYQVCAVLLILAITLKIQPYCAFVRWLQCAILPCWHVPLSGNVRSHEMRCQVLAKSDALQGSVKPWRKTLGVVH